jgi:hypothetical protein
MTQKEVFELVIKAFETLQIPYMICGSVGAMVYGEPRLTNDMDVVVALPDSMITAFHDLFEAKGFYCTPSTVIADEIKKGGQFNLIHQETGIKIDCIILKKHAFSREEFGRKQRRPFTESTEASIATPEDVILKKLEYFQMGESVKHLDDIRSILHISGEELDFAYIDRWVKELKLQESWDQVRNC